MTYTWTSSSLDCLFSLMPASAWRRPCCFTRLFRWKVTGRYYQLITDASCQHVWHPIHTNMKTLWEVILQIKMLLHTCRPEFVPPQLACSLGGDVLPLWIMGHLSVETGVLFSSGGLLAAAGVNGLAGSVQRIRHLNQQQQHVITPFKIYFRA